MNRTTHTRGKSSQQTVEDEELEIEYLKPELKTKMKEEIGKHKEEQLKLLKNTTEYY